MDSSQIIAETIDFLLLIAPILVPIILAWLLFRMWLNFARGRFLSEQEYILFQVVPPTDVYKTPAAMELFLNSLYQTGGEANPVDIYWKGQVRAWFSLEIVSTGGAVHFYIYTRKKLAGYIQSQLYAQYPGAEVIEVDDYVPEVDYRSGKYEMFGLEWKLSEKDPMPIKTYIDYGTDKPPAEEEQQIDPITPTLEFLGALNPGHNAWIQIIVRAHKKEDKDPKKWFSKTDLWKDDAKEIITEIREEGYLDGEDGKKQPVPPTKGQTDRMAAIERSVSKLPFDVGVRGIYIAEKEDFDGTNIGALIGSFKQYNSLQLNSFKPAFTTSFDFWWQDPFGKKVKALKNEVYDAYQEREYFFRDLPIIKDGRKHFVLNSEELATIFHLPGSAAQTPTFERVQAKKAEAPSNLPIQ